MFGYVRPLKGELKVREFEQYQAAYCGLCHCLSRRYGFAARFTVNYDLTFLYCLLAEQEVWSVEQCRCPAGVCKKKACAVGSDAMDYAADLSVLLYYHKLRDAAADERGLRRLAAKAAAGLLRRSYEKASRLRPEQDRVIREQLALLDKLERQQCDSIDRTADTFAQILRSCGDWYSEPDQRRAAGECLYHVGRFIYLADALQDLESDLKKARYNPLALRYTLEQGKLTDADRQSFCRTVFQSADLASAAAELLPGRRNAIVENILYLGLPAVLNSVAAGTFQAKKEHNRSRV